MAVKLLSGNAGTSYTFPTSFDIVGETVSARESSDHIVARRGRVLRSFGQKEDASLITVAGILQSATLAALKTALTNMGAAMGTGAKLELEHDAKDDGNFERIRSVRFNSIATQNRPGQFIQVTITFISAGPWRETFDTSPAIATAVIVSSIGTRFIEATYNGSAPTRPYLRLVASAGTWPGTGTATVKWMGRNLVTNSGLVDGAEFPDGFDDNSGTTGLLFWRKDMGRSGRPAMEVNRTATIGNLRQQPVPVTAGDQYTWSFYAREPNTSPNVGTTGLIQWRTAADGFISNTTVTQAATGAWARYEVTGTAPATAHHAWLTFRAGGNGGQVFTTDWQFEKATPATTYTSTNDPRFKHHSVEWASSIDPTVNSAIMYDFDAGTVDVSLHAAVTALATSVAQAWNGQTFELMPGSNLIHVTSGAEEVHAELTWIQEYVI
jgi:hypothetical protein